MKGFTRAVLLTALFAGTTDLLAAYANQFIKTGKFADKMLYYIAGGALSLKTSMQGGFAIGFLGLMIHYFLAFVYTLAFFLMLPKVKLLSFNKYIVGFLYGVLVGTFMTFVVLPLTRLPHSPFQLQGAIEGWVILGIFLGLPISLSAYAFYEGRK